jgi:DNA-binding NtrC family response regulator
MMADTILWVDDDRSVIDSMAGLLAEHGLDIDPAYTLGEATRKLGDHTFPYRAAVIDLRLGEHDGLELVELAQEKGIPVLLMTGYATVEDTIRAFQAGVNDVLQKPVTDAMLVEALDATRNRRDVRPMVAAERTPFLVGETSRMKQILHLVEAVADTPATVLITGESGSGKSLLAREITRRSGRANGPFVEVSCGALSESLLESELFGHVRGAFTGANSDREGKIAAAEGGTIFLDEIGTASPRMQVKLLRYLQSMEYEPVGSSQTVRSTARVILATNEELETMVAEGRFREDLYYRVNVINICMPPLRDRLADMEVLAGAMLEEANRCLGKNITSIDKKVMAELRRHSWPGNIRELKNVMERAVLLTEGTTLTTAVLSMPGGARRRGTAAEAERPANLKEAMREPERNFIREALARYDGNRGAAALSLGINRTTLYKKMKRLGLESAATVPPFAG